MHDAPRTNLCTPPAAGIDWGRDEWHHVRVVRRADEGLIEVYWDGAEQPVLAARDETFGWGRVGFGSFDDSGLVRNIVVRAPQRRTPPDDAPFGR